MELQGISDAIDAGNLRREVRNRGFGPLPLREALPNPPLPPGDLGGEEARNWQGIAKAA